MSLYKVIFVDDEEEVIQAIIKKMDWEAMGFSVVGYARNGQDALELVDLLNPDVIMTDIKMPFMDGLTLCKCVKERLESIRVIVFSGFDEFEYAKEAIKVEAEEYILKPINAQELQGVFQRVKLSLDKEKKEKRNLDELRSYYQQSLPIMQEQCLSHLISGMIPTHQVASYLKTYQVELQAKLYGVTMIHIDFKQEQLEKPLEVQLFKESVRQYIQEKLSQKWQIKTLIFMENPIVLTLFEQEEEMSHYVNEMDKVCKMTEKIMGVPIIAGIGQLCDKRETIHQSYESAQSVIAYRALHEVSHAVFAGEMEPGFESRQILDMNDIQTIIREIKVGNEAQLEESIQAFVQSLKQVKLAFYEFQIIGMEVITELYKLCGSYQLSLEVIGGEYVASYPNMMHLESIDALEELLKQVCYKIRAHIRQERKDNMKLLIDKAIHFLNENYSDVSCSAEMVCDAMNMSACYFSTVFKKMTGMTIINYLTDLRIKKAKELLKSTDNKTYIIAEQVGYAEANYFSYVFKKYCGMSPTQYRTSGEPL